MFEQSQVGKHFQSLHGIFEKINWQPWNTSTSFWKDKLRYPYLTDYTPNATGPLQNVNIAHLILFHPKGGYFQIEIKK